PVVGSANLLMTALDPARHLPSSAAFALLELSACGGAALLEVELPFAVAVLDRLSGQQGRPCAATQLTRIEEAGLSFALLVALNALRHHQPLQRLFAPRLLSVHLWRREVQDLLAAGLHVGVEVKLEVGGVPGALRLWLPAVAVQAAAAEETPSPGPLAPQVSAASLWARVLAGGSVLDAADLGALERGDVVLLDGIQLDGRQVRGNARLYTSTFQLSGAFTDAGFAVSHARCRANPQESPMSTPPPPPIEEGAALPVEVEVELARLRMPLSELATIKPGAVLALHMNSSEPVLLRVGDRAVARAELVEVEGEVGARILALLP
ncbi:MAG TPA: type III secretion system cytoplasmic ring protein SctQ, partial [Myxococcales bacterium]|nr:type III secretion system cytoplasmic ring protein SctQ [Myxococcales bacterium]